MADSCIVCLGDLLSDEKKPPDTLEPTNGLQSRSGDGGALGKATVIASTPEDPELVAHLLPCGHNLHNECLKPWVERANSCPICRANFNSVELSKYVGGDVIDTYVVQDKQQQAEIDPSMVVDDDLFDEPVNEACMVCEEYGQVMLCDGCNQACHVACAGLDEVPAGAWFCYDCMADPQVLQNASTSRARPMPRQRTVTGRRSRTPRQPTQNQREWARVWQEVQQRIDLDLEFPFEESGEDIQRVEIERLLHDERMRRRTRVAERAGAGQRFQAAVAAIQPSRPDPESQENLRAWNAFDKQIQINQEDSDASASTNRRKRKSPTQSPAQPQQAEAEPARPLKRPRTRRTQDQAIGQGESSSAAAAAATATAGASPLPTTSAPQPTRNEPGNIPTFLQSLLKEVETKPVANGTEAASPPPEPAFSPHEHSLSPRPSSPELSPQSSNHPTPRMMTPPPALSSPRPSSPAALTSVISPIYPQAPEFSPYSPLEEDSIERARGRPRRQPLDRDRTTVNSSPETSPSRGHSSLSYSTKSEIQRMVRSALRPLYNDKKLNKDEYTDINRDVSRLLYDKVEGSGTGLEDEKKRHQLQTVAHDEVEKALSALRSQSPPSVETHEELKVVAQEA